MKRMHELERQPMQRMAGPKWANCVLGLAVLAIAPTGQAANAPALLSPADRAAFRRLAENGEKTFRDANAIEFNMHPAAVLWLRHRDTLSPAARQKLHEILDPAAVAASLNHNVRASYTNIALMSAGNLIVLGEGLNRPEVADEGYKRLQAIFDLTAETGIVEYLSPTYYGTDLNALQSMNTFIQRPAGQRQAHARAKRQVAVSARRPGSSPDPYQHGIAGD